jgi:hypothetical protein
MNDNLDRKFKNLLNFMEGCLLVGTREDLGEGYLDAALTAIADNK